MDRLLQPEDKEDEENAAVERERLIAECYDACRARVKAETERAAAEAEARIARDGGAGLCGGLVGAFEEGRAAWKAELQDSIQALREQVEWERAARARL